MVATYCTTAETPSACEENTEIMAFVLPHRHKVDNCRVSLNTSITVTLSYTVKSIFVSVNISSNFRINLLKWHLFLLQTNLNDKICICTAFWSIKALRLVRRRQIQVEPKASASIGDNLHFIVRPPTCLTDN